jgi:cob(I)alamin adenosyltransferase
MSTYKNPKITINKVYTKAGDKGQTFLIGGHLRKKSDQRIVCYGEIDELNSIIGCCIEQISKIKKTSKDMKNLTLILKRIQNELFNLGTNFATLQDDQSSDLPKIESTHIKNLEKDIDYYNSFLKPLSSFVLPGGSLCNTWLHLARTVCRRVERSAVRLETKEQLNKHSLVYLNRLSDALFVFSRWVINCEGKSESMWDPNFKTT